MEFWGVKVTTERVKRKDFFDNRNTGGIIWSKRFCLLRVINEKFILKKLKKEEEELSQTAFDHFIYRIKLHLITKGFLGGL